MTLTGFIAQSGHPSGRSSLRTVELLALQLRRRAQDSVMLIQKRIPEMFLDRVLGPSSEKSFPTVGEMTFREEADNHRHGDSFGPDSPKPHTAGKLDEYKNLTINRIMAVHFAARRALPLHHSLLPLQTASTLLQHPIAPCLLRTYQPSLQRSFHKSAIKMNGSFDQPVATLDVSQASVCRPSLASHSRTSPSDW